MQLVSTIKCPKCGFDKEETMPTDACRISYQCSNCKTVLMPKQGDCCVFCFYGSVQMSTDAERKARRGRNPQSKQTIQIPTGKIPEFRPGKDLRED